MKGALQQTIKLLLLALFVFLAINGKVQLWMGLLLLGIAASFLFGRIYCGWVCSINTVLGGVTWLKHKLHIKDIPIPKFFIQPWVRKVALGLFIIVFIFTMLSGKKLPVLPAMFLLGIIITFLFPEELWHRYLCPYGTLLRLSSIKAKHGMQINTALCNNCNTCSRVCPAKSVVKTDGRHMIIMEDCLVCMKCARSCKQNAIDYK